MAQTNVRVPGGGNTYIEMSASGSSTTRVAFLANVQDTPGRSVGNPTAIHPIGSPYPVDIAIPYAQGAGQLVFTVWATWGRDGWVSAFMNDEGHSPWKSYTSKGSGGKVGTPCDLREVLEAQRSVGGTLNCKKFELGPDGSSVLRVKTYQGCVISDIDATDNISIETMEQRVRITCMYTRGTITYNGALPTAKKDMDLFIV